MYHPDRWFVPAELLPERCVPPDGSRCDTVIVLQFPFIGLPLRDSFITIVAVMEGIAPILTHLRAHEEVGSVATSESTSVLELVSRQKA